MASLPSDHDASGDHKPTVDEIFAPKQHANALDPYTTVVVGARGTGKSFWAGVLAQQDTRKVAAESYPHLELDNLLVAEGYNGFLSSRILEQVIPKGQESTYAISFWQAVVIKSAEEALSPEKTVKKLSKYMEKYSDPEETDIYLNKVDKKLDSMGKTLLITFDALDKLSKEWSRSTYILDALFEVVWDLRVRKSIKAKIFIRPEQLNDENLKFIEIPKLRSSRVELEWSQVELYGLLFSRLAYTCNNVDFQKLASEIGSPFRKLSYKQRSAWSLLYDREHQKDMMAALAGPYMGANFKKGGTYDWPYKHLADANGNVTPRSFIKLFTEAAKYTHVSKERAITPEGIRHGLREASKVRVDQLGIEYVWVKRALAPLAGLRVPCVAEEIYSRWKDSNTVKIIMDASTHPDTGFLPPYAYRTQKVKYPADAEALSDAMVKIGLFDHRQDGRIDIPDLFRVAALMLKKGGITPKAKNK